MELKEVLAIIEASKDFKEWKKEHSDGFLAHAFMLLDEPNKDVWQIGYFSPKEDKMSTFIADANTIIVTPDLEVMKADVHIQQLNPDEVKIDPHAAVTIANQRRIAQYKNERPLKIFFIIQKIDLGSVFNITFFTESFKTINFKISTLDGEILKESSQNLAEFSNQ